MKTSNVKKLLSVCLVAILLAPSITYAASGSKAEEKAREAVENAAPDDWFTLASSAEKLMKKRKNLEEANGWIDQSIEIKETAYNLALKGDYYMAKRLPENALEYFLRAMNVAKEENEGADLSNLQRKVAEITNIGG